ncbi:hypothetical protein TrRE_jg10176, partial [Triparma retinervis]
LFLIFTSPTMSESTLLLLYLLTTASKSFDSHVKSRTDLDKIVRPILRCIYAATSRSPPPSSPLLSRGRGQLYACVIMLLQWSSEYGFCTDLFARTFLPEVPWYRERRLRGASGGGLLVLVAARLVTMNLNRMNDGYLLGNTLAVVSNVRHHVRNLEE